MFGGCNTSLSKDAFLVVCTSAMFVSDFATFTVSRKDTRDEMNIFASLASGSVRGKSLLVL